VSGEHDPPVVLSGASAGALNVPGMAGQPPITAAEASHRFNLSSWTLKHQALVAFLLALITLFGVLSYSKLAQSEDPPFTFKVMVVRTLWPGATARQV
jgi:multidrug efflux pump